MKYLRLPAQAGSVIQLQKSGEYWQNRADRHRRAGDRRKVAALLRHAVNQSPNDPDLRVEYALALQEMSCFEASNRAAFGALLLKPDHFASYGVIGRNMMALGLEQEAMDAFTRYLTAARKAGTMSAWDDEIDEIEMRYYGSEEPPARSARYEALVNIAGQRLAHGDPEGMKRALDRMRPMPFRDERYTTLRSLYRQALGEYDRAVGDALRAVRQNPKSIQALCTLASAQAMGGHCGKASQALMAAVLLAANEPRQEQLICATAQNLGLDALVLAMMQRKRRELPDRLPTLYDEAIALTHLGRIDEALRLLDRCRLLDPTDVPSRVTANLLRERLHAGAAPQDGEHRATDALAASSAAMPLSHEPVAFASVGKQGDVSDDIQPASGDNQPVLAGGQSASGDNQPASADSQPLSDDIQPVLAGGQSASDEVQPAFGGGQSASDEVQPAFSGGQPASGDHQPASHDHRPASPSADASACRSVKRQLRLPFYPMLAPEALNALLAKLAQPLGEGVDAFCKRLTDSEAFYNEFLYVLGMPESSMGRLLALVAVHLPKPFAEQLLRETLVLPMPDEGVKRYAAASLVAIGAKPPFVLWHAGHIGEMNPSVGAAKQNAATVAAMRLILRTLWRREHDARLTTHAAGLIARMSAAQLHLLTDEPDACALAMELHWRNALKLPESARLERLCRQSAEQRRKVQLVYRVLTRTVSDGAR